ncbi:hypothetical protein Bca52824_044675 [Brassica carinata]|uniref:Uncharacterized protein n=1 Tax=Brassica carinata TaxID=52824 RepID=A0A8X7RB41_BRACI|nr:hypothetical protein Bca52824_044675 [Brassica carinata]
MRANLGSLVAKAYRVRQGRTFSSSSSSATNPIDNKVNNLSNMVAWFTAGYVFKFGWEASALYKSKRKSDKLWEEYRRELERYHEERFGFRSLKLTPICVLFLLSRAFRRQNRSLRGLSEE